MNTKQKFQLTSYSSQFVNTFFLYIQQILIFFLQKKKSIKKEIPSQKCLHLDVRF